ncbi:TPA: hypothetical protein I7291_03540 [Vibrio parahaemolyticus]|nr:hypothetical protein [Vibrio parahaemolyticus]HAS6914363.1 hypothetical protein [Vibrio parahaemolyticus]HAS6924837.1 hypothetical protein [Vibrio parahaemolyticus]
MSEQTVWNDADSLVERIKTLRHQVWQANMDLQRHNLVTFTWGNVSGIDRESGLVVIKPSGVEYCELNAENMVVVDLHGQVVEVVAGMALQTLQINAEVDTLNPSLLDKHYLRKHGANAYYGQSKK